MLPAIYKHAGCSRHLVPLLRLLPHLSASSIQFLSFLKHPLDAMVFSFWTVSAAGGGKNGRGIAFVYI